MLALDCAHFVGCLPDRAGAILDHQEAAATGTQQLFVHELLHRNLGIYRITVCRHHIFHAQAAEKCARLDLHECGASCLQKEPTDKGNLESPKSCSLKEAENSKDNEQNGDDDLPTNAPAPR